MSKNKIIKFRCNDHFKTYLNIWHICPIVCNYPKGIAVTYRKTINSLIPNGLLTNCLMQFEVLNIIIPKVKLDLQANSVPVNNFF